MRGNMINPGFHALIAVAQDQGDMRMQIIREIQLGCPPDPIVYLGLSVFQLRRKVRKLEQARVLIIASAISFRFAPESFRQQKGKK